MTMEGVGGPAESAATADEAPALAALDLPPRATRRRHQVRVGQTEAPAAARGSRRRGRRRRNQGARTAASRRHQVAQLLDARGPDPGNRVELFDRRERAVLRAIIE